jgi:hypothetical protein
MVPLPRVHNALVIVAMFLVAGSLLPWNPHCRFVCAAVSVGIVLFLFIARLRSHKGAFASEADRAVRARVERIRAARDARMGRRR